ncbi:Dabb family protein [Herbiconiux moechotypicola]|uniref:Stress-response A/B barrel domain-containing protein n=1 Tax=Herbiconiux moechotypicola TaxID=637393 RepID=A0ABN3DZY9_9MICO|nr:Dabb family protein [Herbiconiux moechotypicola]MCS5731141.1 Dabb family protein [Herbiconiux moechotypicola]
MIRHVVAWKLSATDPAQKAADAAAITALLSSLPPLIPSIASLTVGPNVAYFEKNWDVVLVADYATLADLDAYQQHPAHLEVAPQVAALVSDRASVDIEL